MDVDFILNGKANSNQLVEFFQSGYDEYLIVIGIKKYLRTPEQKEMLNSFDLSVEDILNGRFYRAEEEMVENIFENWNYKLGKKVFGF